MTSTSKGQGLSPRVMDRVMLLILVINGGVAVAVGADWARITWSTGLVAAAIGLAGCAVWRWSGAPGARLTLAAALGVLALSQQLGGVSSGVAQWSLHLSLCMLLAYRDWRPIALLGTLGCIGLCAMGPWAAPLGLGAGLAPVAVPQATPDLLLALLFLTLQTLVLCALAHQQHQQARAAHELEFLVKTMGRDGKILLNLDVIRAETPMGQRLQHVQQRMLDAIRAVHEAAQRVDRAAQRVATGSGQLMARTEDTASGLHDAVMSLEQINVIVKHSTEASHEAKQMSDTAAEIADRGGTTVSNVVQTMKDIQSSSQRIHDIVGVIDGIAFQTNILALNAAVEAARAGEHGRGFAVVASEVRSLASRSAAAAKEIKHLIATSASAVKSGAEQVAQAGTTMHELVDSVRRVGSLFDEVTSDTSDHMQSLNVVSQSMSDLGSITQHNVELAEQTDAAASDLQALASRLAEVLNAFHLPASAQLPDLPGAPAERIQRPKPAERSAGPATSTGPTATFF